MSFLQHPSPGLLNLPRTGFSLWHFFFFAIDILNEFELPLAYILEWSKT